MDTAWEREVMRMLDRLSEKVVKNAKPERGKFVVRLADGGGLYLQATVSKAGGINRNWIFRYELDGARHDMGLGPLGSNNNEVSLAEAREKAKDYRSKLRAGIDPLESRNDETAKLREGAEAERGKMAKAVTFKQCAEQYAAAHGRKWTPKHAAQWHLSLEQYAYSRIGDLPVANIDTPILVEVLRPIWDRIPPSASRLRGRIEQILKFATAWKLRTGDNPASHLPMLLGSAAKADAHHAAMSFDEAPAFMAELRKRPASTSAAALEIAALTACRTGEVIGARWSEIKGNVWTIPAARMKTGVEHRVPLCKRAVEILDGLERHGEYVFVSRHGNRLTDTAVLRYLKDMGSDATVHGFRSTFRDWAAERTSFPHDVCEMALAHTIKNKTEAAYKRTDLFEKRRKLMDQWARFLDKPIPAEGGKVVDLQKRRAG
jgi:integrase